MDPFTEKLLERTRARRENLRKKLADRPAPANRQMAKRAREPLAETNSVVCEPVIDTAPHPSTKPSPSKRRCSGENAQPTIGEENREPSMARAVTPTLTDPQTDRKPPAGPASVRSSSSLEKQTIRPAPEPEKMAVRPSPEPEKMAVRPSPEPEKMALRPSPEPEKMALRPSPEPEKMAVRASPVPEKMAVRPVLEPQRSRDVEMVPSSPAPQRNRVEQNEAPTPTTIKSRLQRLAEQRHYWDADGTSDVVPDCAPPSPVKTQRQEVAPVTVPLSSEAPVGRKGRLANLAATIGSWEEDLSHPMCSRQDNAQGQPGTAWAPPPARREAAAAKPSSAANRPLPSQTSANKPVHSSNPLPVHSPVKSNRVVLPSPQKTEVPEAKPALQTARGLPSPVASPQKSYPSNQGRAFPSSPQKVGPSAVSQSPLKNQALSRGPDCNASPQKPDLLTKPSTTGHSVLQTRGKFVKDSTPLQQRGAAGSPGVKSFLERFGERCQERSTHSSPAAGAGQGQAQTCTPTLTPSVTPNTRLVQERLRAAQSANTTTADLTQKQKLERESELSQIRSRFQKAGNMWKNKDEGTDTKKHTETKELVEQPEERKPVASQPDDKPTAALLEILSPAPKSSPAGKPNGLVSTTPTSSPLKRVGFSVDKHSDEEASEDQEDEEEVREIEMNVDQSINSDVINELFDGALEESDEHSGGSDDDEEGEEDALNISSMSILTPLVETVAAVAKSPEKRMMTSTPASSFNEKSQTPDNVSRPSKFQRARMLRAGSSDSLEASEDDHNLPYSISAYRSTRIKEPERPHVKQVIVRNEDVTRRAEEPKGSGGHANIKQKMKVLTNEMNLQQTVIHQASQALNCCTDEEHGKGSQVEAEAERLLLIATERRVALKAELDRLKGDPAGQRRGQGGSSKAQEDIMGVSASKGSISLVELRLPLKADFVCSAANKPESANHYFFIMIRAGAENDVATPLANTRTALSGDALIFSTKFTMANVSNDFGIDIEVYYLVQKREPSSDKRKKPSKSKAITPKRFLAITKSSQTPVMASPGGPNAVRTSHFVLVGSHKLTLASIGKNKFHLEKIKYERSERELLSDMFLNKVPFLCPMEGHIYLKMQCEVGSMVEERGFLTMFEDVSGFGAWHRRWCVLSGYCISYWTYPDDEKRKNPMGRINLANCTSRKVEPANREFCARPNTFELVTVRPQREDDKETLVSQCKNTMCVTKNWLCADTKDERNLWMQKLNQILVDLRMWQPDSCYRPV